MSRLPRALFALPLLVALSIAAPAHAKLKAPGLQSPTAGATVEAFPALTWSPVRHADHYEVQVAADSKFKSPVGIFGRSGGVSTRNTAATPDKSAADGTYYWRVRAISAANRAGRWAPARKLDKAWETAPLLQGGDGLAVSWPAVPLVLRWSLVPHAHSYLVTIATDDALSNVVLGSSSKPLETIGNVYALPTTLPPGTYSWAVTPVDTDGHKGQRSVIGHFNWMWPTRTTVRVADLDDDPRVFDPQFSWDAVPGAASYEVEVNTTQDFTPGSKWCCTDKTIGTSLSPKSVLANNAYYLRIRAFDPDGNAGDWNTLPGNEPFTKAFDDVAPTVPGLRLVDATGGALATGTTTDTPIVRWDPVPGASRYELQTIEYQDGLGCDWAQAHAMQTSTTGWTPLASSGDLGPSAWPSPQRDSGDPAAPGAGSTPYCLRVLARSDDDAKSSQVISNWTQLGDAATPAFRFGAAPAVGSAASPFVMPDGNYLPLEGQVAPIPLVTRTPVFTWQRVDGARAYYVVASRDANFTKIADIGVTHVPAYAPRLRSSGGGVAVPLSDETTHYYWAVFPATDSDGDGVFSDWSDNSPHAFDKSSQPPALIGPTGGAEVTTQPTFRWTEAENAREYRLQVSQDPTFGDPIDDVVTDSTAFTSSSTYPADTEIFWRVRANDWNGTGLNWSAVGTFRRRLIAPALAPDNPATGELVPALSWQPVDGAVSYGVHVDQGDGGSRDFTVASRVFTPTNVSGLGILHWKVRANFPTSGSGTVSSGYSPSLAYTRTLGPVRNVNALKSGARLLITWDPEPAAKSYRAEISKTDAFGSTVESTRTTSAAWAPKLTSRPGGRLYWRVAPVDSGGSEGAFASGSFRLPKTLRVTTTAVAFRGRTRSLTVVVKDSDGRAVRRARVTVTGAGSPTRRARTNRKGTAVVPVRPRRKGVLTVAASRKGYADGATRVTVR